MNIKRYLRKMSRILPDKWAICLDYYRFLGKFPDLKNPKSFNEKLQWLKLYDRRQEYVQMVDKYAVKQYVSKRVGEEHIVPNYGVWEHFDDIDFDKLPDQFVLKCTHDCGGLVICRDKTKLDMKAAKAKLEESLKRNYYWQGREWPYKNVPPRIIAEKYLEDSGNHGLTDYKFYCFNGVPQFLYISRGLEDQSTAEISFLTMDWQFAAYKRIDYKPFAQLPEKPHHFDQMVEIAKTLSAGIDFVRVDLYEIEEQIYFSELTLTPSAGCVPFDNPEHDLEVGKLLILTQKEK